MAEVIDEVVEKQIARRSGAILREHQFAVCQLNDRLFAVLLIFQWVAGIAIALTISPQTWAGRFSATHIHVWTATLLGGIIICAPIMLAFQYPGRALTRHVIAVAQMLYSALLIHLTGGRIETHFHVFGSLAFLAVYRDWRVLVTASIVVIGDHLLRGIFYPQSIYGVLRIEPWRWVEHAWWVIFEDLFLVQACLANVKLMSKMALRQAQVEKTQEHVEELVESRTKELHSSQLRLSVQYAVTRALAESTTFAEAAPKILLAIGSGGILSKSDTVHGVIWQVDHKKERLVCVDSLAMSASVADFSALSAGWRFAFGVGLPGRVWRSQLLAQIDDMPSDDNVPRSKAALAAGLRFAFAFPVLAENEVTGVIEFMTSERSQLTKDDRDMFESLGRQIGQFQIRKRAEAESLHLANIVHFSRDAIIGHTVDGTITSWNSGAERMFGYTVDEVKGKNLAILIPADRADEWSSTMTGISQAQTVEALEVTHQRKDGTSIEVSLTRSPMFDQGQAIVGASTILRDVTERRAAEKRVSEFYSTVSHELRTPLTSIRGVLGLMEGGVVDLNSSEALSLVQMARTSTDRLIRLINDILDLKKIEAGKFELQLEEVDTGEVVANTLDPLEVTAEEKGIRLDSRVAALISLRADRDRTIQVLTNLVSNAIKFAPTGSRVSVTVERAAFDRARFCVTDDGPGIPENQMHKLFAHFQQLDSSDTRVQGGTGLGLAVCKAIVEEHGGGIGVESVVGKGSTFWFELPLWDEAQAGDKQPTVESKSELGDSGDSSGSRRLACDNERPDGAVRLSWPIVKSAGILSAPSITRTKTLRCL